jgi:hypothetical protein
MIVVSYPFCLRYFPLFLHISGDRPTLVGAGFVIFSSKGAESLFSGSSGLIDGFYGSLLLLQRVLLDILFTMTWNWIILGW